MSQPWASIVKYQSTLYHIAPVIQTCSDINRTSKGLDLEAEKFLIKSYGTENTSQIPRKYSFYVTCLLQNVESPPREDDPFLFYSTSFPVKGIPMALRRSRASLSVLALVWMVM